MAHCILVRVLSAGRVGTEFTDVGTDIGRVDMPVDIEVGFSTVFFPAYRIGKFS